MKLITHLLLIISLTSCTSQKFKPQKFTIKNLDSWASSRNFGSIQDDGFTESEIRTQDTIEFDSDGTPSASRETRNRLSNGTVKSVKFIVHPETLLERVVPITEKFTSIERLEFWTQYGIFIVGGPAYGSRRLPYPKSNDVDLDVNYSQKTYSSDSFESESLDLTIEHIFSKLKLEKQGFKNVKFSFDQKEKWGNVELVIASMFAKINSLRGLWIGPSEEDKNTMIIHFHDIKN